MLSLEELLACGLSRAEVAGRCRRGTLHRLHRGVYAVGHRPLTDEGTLLAAVKALGSHAILSHFSAAALWRLVEWDGREPEVTVPGAGTLRVPGVRVHRPRTLKRSEWRSHKGIPVTIPERTLTDLASILPYKPLRRATREALAIRLVSLRSLSRAIERRGTFRGKRTLLRVLADAAPTRTELEDVVLDLVLDAGFAPPDVNVPLVIAGRRLVPDLRWHDQQVIVEADGGQWHNHALARADDAERQALLEANGERIVRVTWRQATLQRTETIARLATAGAPR